MRNRDRFTRPFEGIDEYTKLCIQPLGTAYDSVLPASATLYLPLNESSNVFTDHSTATESVTNNGPVLTSGTQSKFWTTSAYCAGSATYLQMPSLGLGSGSFVVHFQIYPTSIDAQGEFLCTYALSSAYTGILLRNDGLYMATGAGWGINGVSWTTGLTLNAWNHVALVRSGTLVYMYVNGTRTLSASGFTGSLYQENGFFINTGTFGTKPVTAYYQEFTVLKGSDNGWVGSTITVPTSAYSISSSLLPMPIDRSFYSKTITTTGTVSPVNIAGAFNGQAVRNSNVGNTLSYMEIADHVDFAFSTDTRYADSFKFCIDMRVNPIGSNQHGGFYQQYVDANNYILLRSYDNGGTPTLQFKVRSSSTTVADYSCAYTMSAGTWYQLAVLRDDTGIKIKVNGIDLTLTVTQSIAVLPMPDIASVVRIGYDAVGTRSFYGYLQEIRVSKGTDRYDYRSGVWNGTPNVRSYLPTSYKYGIDKYTMFLLSGDSLKDNSFYNQTITNTGVTITTDTPQFMGSSLAFNGSSYMTLGTSPMVLGGSSFVIETQAYFTNISALRDIFSWRTDINNRICFYWNSNNTICMDIISGGSNVASIANTFTPSINTWYHLALVRSGNTFSIYVNGTRGTPTTYSFTFPAYTESPYIGYRTSAMLGYFSQYRISVGTDRGWAGSTITVPTAPYAIQTVPRQILDRFPTNPNLTGSDAYAAVYTPSLTQITTSQLSKWQTFSNYTPYGVCTAHPYLSNGTGYGTFFWLGTCGYHRATGGSPIIVMHSQFVDSSAYGTRVVIWIDTSNYIRSMRTSFTPGSSSTVYTKSTTPITTSNAPIFLYARRDTHTIVGSDIVVAGTPTTMTSDFGGYDIIGGWPGTTTFITMGYLNDLFTDFGYNSGSARTCPVLNTFTSNPLAKTVSSYITSSAFRGSSRFYLTSALHASGSGTNGLPMVMANAEQSLYMAIIPTPTYVFIILMKRFANGSLVDMTYKYALSSVLISSSLSTDAWHSIMFSLNLDSTTGGVAAGSVLGIDGKLYTSFSVTTSSEGSPSLAGLTAALQVSGYVTDLDIASAAPLGTATTYPTRSFSFIP